MENTAKHIATGQRGEALAAALLAGEGYLVIERNWRYQKCEVDLIASKANVLHFFEVKTRTGHPLALPEASVSVQKMSRLKHAAEAYLRQYPQWKWIQFNIVAINLNKEREPDIFLVEDVY